MSLALKKRFGMALIITALGAMLIGGGTLALFTADATNEGNTFTAGTVAIDVNKDALFVVTQDIDGGLAPGDSGEATLTIENTGTLAAFVRVNDIVGSGDLFEGDNPLEITHDGTVVEVAAGGSVVVTFEYYFPLEAGNEYQGAEGSFDIEVEAVQSRNNKDDDGNPISWNQDAS